MSSLLYRKSIFKNLTKRFNIKLSRLVRHLPASRQTSSGFTIVELLVVIVVIGILASIVVVSYTGISRKAIIASIQSDLSNNAKLLKLYQVEYGSFPASLDEDNCPSAPSVDNKYCLKTSGNTTIAYTGDNSSFILTETDNNSSISYQIDETGQIAEATSGGVGSGSFAVAWVGDDYEGASSVIHTNDGGFVVTGQTWSFSLPGDIFITKYTSEGALLWNKTWGGTDDEKAYSVAQVADGGYVVVGRTNSFDSGDLNMFIVKYTSSGTMVWNKVWSGSGFEWGNSIVGTDDGGFVITGQTSSFAGSNGKYAMFIAKFASDGTSTWSKYWYTGGAYSDNGNSVIQTGDGGFVVIGSTNSLYNNNEADAFIVKYTSSGDLSWSKTWGGVGGDYVSSIAETGDGFIATGYTNSYSSGDIDMLVAKYATNGDLSWVKTWGGSDDDTGAAISRLANDTIIAVGYTSSFDDPVNGDAFLVNYTDDGTLLWSKTWGGTSWDEADAVMSTDDGGFIVAGATGSFGDEDGDSMLLKYLNSGDISGCSSLVCRSVVSASVAQTVTTGIPTVTDGVPSIVMTIPSATETTPSATITNLIQ